ncbi:hypothetical protein Tco_0787991 [Tanacetum coccineum]
MEVVVAATMAAAATAVVHGGCDGGDFYEVDRRRGGGVRWGRWCEGGGWLWRGVDEGGGDWPESGRNEGEAPKNIGQGEDLVPISSESDDTSESDSECDLPSCDDFSPINIPEGKSVTFSNPLFDSNKDFTSSDDESLSDEDVPEDKVKIYSNPLFEFDDEYISSDVNPLFDEVLENIESKDSYVSNLDEPALLVTPLSDANEDECFDPGGEIDEIDAFLDMDISTDIENGYHDSEGDIIYLESLLIDDTIPNLSPEVFLDHDPRNFKDEPDKDDLKSIVKVFNLGIWENKFSPTHVELPFEDRHYLSLTYDCPDFEDSRARGFVHRLLELQSLACLYMGI